MHSQQDGNTAALLNQFLVLFPQSFPHSHTHTHSNTHTHTHTSQFLHKSHDLCLQASASSFRRQTHTHTHTHTSTRATYDVTYLGACINACNIGQLSLHLHCCCCCCCGRSGRLHFRECMNELIQESIL